MTVSAYQVNEHVRVEACPQLDGADRWAVRQGSGLCLAITGEWEYEPMPSQRDEAFLDRCRFQSPEEAISTYQLQSQQKG